MTGTGTAIGDVVHVVERHAPRAMQLVPLGEQLVHALLEPGVAGGTGNHRAGPVVRHPRSLLLLYNPDRLQSADDAADAHFAEMAQAGWELVTTTATEYTSGGTPAHHFIWKRHV